MAALLYSEQPVSFSEADGRLSEPCAHPCPGGDGIDAEAADALLGYLVGDDAQDGKLAGGEAACEGRGDRPGAGQQAAPVTGCDPVGRHGAPAWREEAHTARRNAHGHDPGPDDAPALVKPLSEALSARIVHGTARVR